MAILNKSCCGCSLQMGTVIIAVFYLIGSFAPVAVTVQYWSAEENNTNSTFSCRKNYTIFETDICKMWIQLDHNQEKMKACGGANILQAICAVFLILGASQGKALMLIPWVIVQSLLVLVLSIVSIMLATVWGFALICAVVIYVLISVYFLLVVFSYYQTLRDSEWDGEGVHV